ncbi:hypothetical protein GJAV_G00084070 [Gymnothorax javanicus]|nr:hypothetical protein GJAV_G00084070 [Gymnothorax javanicus]
MRNAQSANGGDSSHFGASSNVIDVYGKFRRDLADMCFRSMAASDEIDVRRELKTKADQVQDLREFLIIPQHQDVENATGCWWLHGQTEEGCLWEDDGELVVTPLSGSQQSDGKGLKQRAVCYSTDQLRSVGDEGDVFNYEETKVPDVEQGYGAEEQLSLNSADVIEGENDIVAKLLHDKSCLKKMNSDLQETVFVTEDSNAILRAENSMLRNQAKGMKEAVDSAKLQVDEVEELRSSLAELTKAKGELETIVKHMEKENGMLKSQLETLTNEMSNTTERQMDKEKIIHLSSLLQDLQMDVEETRLTLDHKEEVIRRKDFQIEQLESSQAEYSLIVHDLKDKLKDLEDQLAEALIAGEGSFQSLDGTFTPSARSSSISLCEELRLLQQDSVQEPHEEEKEVQEIASDSSIPELRWWERRWSRVKRGAHAGVFTVRLLLPLCLAPSRQRVPDKRCYCGAVERLLEQLRRQLEAGCFCDCTVAIGASRFRAHRNVLAAFSEYFCAQWQGSTEDSVTTSLDPEYVNEEVFQKLLDYVYTGYLSVDSDSVEDICQAASFLRMDSVVTLCILVLEDVKPVCVGAGERGDSQEEEEPVPPSPDVSECFAPMEADDEEMEGSPQEVEGPGTLNDRDGDLQPDSLREEMDQQAGGEEVEGEAGEEAEMEERVVKPRVSQRARKPKVMPDGSILKNCTAAVYREPRHPEGQPDPTVKSSSTRASQSPRTRAADPDWEALWGTEEGDRGPVKEEKCAAKRKRGRPRKGRLKENRSEQDEEDDEVVITNGKPQCGICERTFSDIGSARRHMRIHRGVKPYECQLCNKAFRQGNQLKTHMRTHTGEKPFRCDVCDKSFAQKCQVVFHRRMHHGEEKPYKCDSCGLQFATSSNFKIHVRKHSGEKPYRCERCGKRFAQSSTLTYHMRRHTGEKPYVCDTCGKAFSVSSSLITHSRKHTGSSCFCIECCKVFTTTEELEKHYPCVKTMKKYKCDLCERSYTDAKYLKKHRLKVHDVSDQQPQPLPFPVNIPIDHQSLLSRVPPGPSTAELMTRAKAAADAEAAAAAAAAAEVVAAAAEAVAAATAIDENETVTEYILFHTLD